jgi:dihydroorotase
VHLLADAGSAGEGTVRGLVDYVLPRAETEIRIWLNIGSHGLVHLREVADPTFMDVDATLAAVAAHRELIRGIKVRSSGLIVGGMGLQPLQLARLAAREAGLPLMVHIGEAPPPIADVLDLLETGDVVTHCFHGKTGRPWFADGTPIPALRRALDRGVRLDVGHGAASLSIDVARAAVAAGTVPHSISTDIHVRNIDGPVFSLAAVMTKLLHCGLPLPDVIRGVTDHPRQTLGLPKPWRSSDGTVQHATLFRLSDQAPVGRRYVDAMGTPFAPTRHIVPVATIRNGVTHPVSLG